MKRHESLIEQAAIGTLHILEELEGPVTWCGVRAASASRGPVHLGRVASMSATTLREVDVCRACVAAALVRLAGAAAAAAAVLGRLDGRVE